MLYQRIMQGAELFQCPSCQRILYFGPADEAAGDGSAVDGGAAPAASTPAGASPAAAAAEPASGATQSTS